MDSSTRLFLKIKVQVFRRAVVLWVALLGYIAISLRCSTERNLSDRLFSLAAWQFLLFPRMTLSFV